MNAAASKFVPSVPHTRNAGGCGRAHSALTRRWSPAMFSASRWSAASRMTAGSRFTRAIPIWRHHCARSRALSAARRSTVSSPMLTA